MVSSRPESEWTDEERSKMLALDIYEAGIGPCGHHHAETVDPQNFFYDIKSFRCPVCAQKAVDDRVRAEAVKEWEKQQGPDGPEPSVRRPDDGVVTAVVRVPKDEALARIEEAKKARGGGDGNQA